MKLSAVRVQNYRSIIDSGLVEIEDHVTVLIGKNEQGKTTFLKGIASFAHDKRYSPSDLPKHLTVTLEQQPPSEIPVVTLKFALSATDRDDLKPILTQANTVRYVSVTKYRDGEYKFRSVSEDDEEQEITFQAPDINSHTAEIERITNELRSKLGAHASRYAPFAQHIAQATQQITNFLSSNFNVANQLDDLFKTFTASLAGVPGLDKPIQDDIAIASKAVKTELDKLKQTLSANSTDVLWSLVPHLAFHSSSVDKIPNQVNLAEFIANPDATSPGMAKLCRASGMSVQKIQELSTQEPAAREAYEDTYRSTISGAINAFWTQQTYNVHFRIEKERLSVSISDSTYAPRIPPLDRSDGFQWYLSFYSTVLDEASSGGNIVLLLDNPALELHSDGQRDIKKFLEDRYSSTAQVIYVTHSSAMVDPYRLDQIRCVTLSAEHGTQIAKLKTKLPNDLDLLEPVRSAIGASLVATLAFNKLNVLTEGASDKPILDAAVAIFRPELKNTWVINGGIAEAAAMLPMFLERAKLPYVINLDDDSGGRQLKKVLVTAGVPEKRILTLRDVLGAEFLKGKDIEIEDIVSPELYHEAVAATYPSSKVDKPPADQSKRSKYYEDKFKKDYGIGFSKKRVADNVKQLIEQGRSDETTKSQFKTLISALEKQLQAD